MPEFPIRVSLEMYMEIVAISTDETAAQKYARTLFRELMLSRLSDRDIHVEFKRSRHRGIRERSMP